MIFSHITGPGIMRRPWKLKYAFNTVAMLVRGIGAVRERDRGQSKKLIKKLKIGFNFGDRGFWFGWLVGVGVVGEGQSKKQ